MWWFSFFFLNFGIHLENKNIVTEYFTLFYFSHFGEISHLKNID